MQCPNCRGQISDDAKFCPLCGKPVEIPKTVSQFCPNCGIKLVPNAAFCNGCGAKVNESLPQDKLGSAGVLNKETLTTAETQGLAPVSTMVASQVGNGGQEIDLAEMWNTLISIVFKIPDFKIDRIKFLREKLAPLCYKNEIEAAIAGNPTEIINPQIIAKVANQCIEEKQAKMSSSLILKLANFAISKTAIGPVLDVLGYLGIKIEPADFVVYYYMEVKLLQEIAYLYGFPAMFDNSGKPLANTVDVLTMCIAVTADEAVAKEKLKQYLKKDALASKLEDIKLDLNVLKRILPSLIMVSKDNFTYNSKILQNYLHGIYFGGIPEKSTLETTSDLFQDEPSKGNFIVRLLDFFGFILSFPWGGFSYKKFKKRPVWRRAINWLYAGFLCCVIFAFVSEYLEPPLPQYESVTDSRDGHSYKSMTIDGKKWIMENMQYDVPGSICRNCAQSGRLYTFIDALEACPEGFGLPSQNEYQSLSQYAEKNKSLVQMVYEYLGKASYASGNVLKSKGFWSGKEKGADIIGFNAVPTGFYSFKDSVVKRSDETTGFWTSDMTEKGAVRMKLETDEDTVSFGALNRNYGFSVRCVQKNEKYRENIDSALVKISLNELSQNIKTYIQLQDSFVNEKYRVAYAELKFKPVYMEFWNLNGAKVQRNCVEITASLKKGFANCEKGSMFNLYAIPYGKKVRYLANPIVSPSQESELNDGCQWFDISLTDFSETSQFKWVANDGIVWDGNCRDINSLFNGLSEVDDEDIRYHSVYGGE